MSIDDNSIGMYFTSPQDLRAIKPLRAHEENVVEYDMDDTPPSSRPYSITEEYVLANSKDGINEAQVEINQPRPKRPIVQDVYDEDHYCFARPEEDGADRIKTDLQKDEEEKDSNPLVGVYKRCDLTKKRIIIFIFSILFFVLSIVGIALYFSSITKGTL